MIYQIIGVVSGAIFLIVGLWRLVEIKDAPISPSQRKVFYPLHILGTILFSIVIGFAGYDVSPTQKLYLAGCFLVAALTLFPMHIFVALKRRIQAKK